MLSYEDCVSFCELLRLDRWRLDELLSTETICGKKLRAAVHAKICEPDETPFCDVLLTKDENPSEWKKKGYCEQFEIRGIFDRTRDNMEWNFHESGDRLNGYCDSDRIYAWEPYLFKFTFSVWVNITECGEDFMDLLAMDDYALAEAAKNIYGFAWSLKDIVSFFVDELMMDCCNEIQEDEYFDETLFTMNVMHYGLLSAYYMDCFLGGRAANEKLLLKMEQCFSKVVCTDAMEDWYGDDAVYYNDYFFEWFVDKSPNVVKEARTIIFPLEILSHMDNDQSANESYPIGYFFKDGNLKKYQVLKEKKYIEKYVLLMEPLVGILEDPYEIGDDAFEGYTLLSGEALVNSGYCTDAFYYACVMLGDDEKSYSEFPLIAEARKVFDRLVELYEQELGECG